MTYSSVMRSDLFAVKKDEELVLQRGSLPLLHFIVHFYGLPKGVPEEWLEVVQMPFSFPSVLFVITIPIGLKS